ncbi:helix-turn-helix domain-containing protein [Paenibacillus alkalitolerans]|uniref:helix-turn-helix domain-containing protein n=1 Tax=Paenibacillus alkalitolerans TaxID=2799335 RepID=UPI002D7EC7C9|nr:helix-turn-helix domain-containing protein [Paenibacillus alkalitolerans]
MLKSTREALGMTLETAAKHLRIPPGYLLQIERGDRGVGVERAEQIASLYETRRDVLFDASRFTARLDRKRQPKVVRDDEYM